MSTTRTTKTTDRPDAQPHTGITVPAPSTQAAAAVYQQLRTHLATLRLHDAAAALPAVLDAATAEGLSLTTALERLLAVEVDATEARRLAGRLRFACLPTPATLQGFDYDCAPGVDRALITELGTCRFLDSATNVLLIGPPGVGKTHLAVGLARAAAHAGYRTYFTSAADLHLSGARPLSPRRHRRPLGHHHAVLCRPDPARHRPMPTPRLCRATG